MYRGDRARKETLVEYGFRLPSALDNRPLQFEESQARFNQVVFVSATPADYERRASGDAVVELIVRPTGLVDPPMEVRSARNQVDDLHDEIRACARRGERVLVTTLTKRMAEDLTEYYSDLGLKVRYLHSDISTLERIEIIRDLRLGTFDVLVGINLLREGLDIPEVSLVAVLDADKEGFLRSTRSLIQTCGRAARNVNGTGHPLRRDRDPVDGPGPGGNRPPPPHPGGLQPGAPDHPRDHPQGHHRDLRLRPAAAPATGGVAEALDRYGSADDIVADIRDARVGRCTPPRATSTSSRRPSCATASDG